MNTCLALLLVGYDGIQAMSEVRSGAQAVDITVRHSDTTDPVPIYIEAKIGASPAKRRAAAKQARSRLTSGSRALAFGICYPAHLRRGRASVQRLRESLAKAPLAFAPVYRYGGKPSWREGSVGDFANSLRNSDLSRRRVADTIEHSVRRAAEALYELGCARALAQALALPHTATDLKAGSLVASLVLSNATLLHHRLRLVPAMSDVGTLEAALQDPGSVPGAVRKAWDAILKIDYHPVFAPALAALNALSDRDAQNPLQRIGLCAVAVADELASLRFDHAGSIYHRLLATAPYDGSFYTSNVSALLLARLALSEDWADWADADALTELRVIDPACGTGTLLMAAMHAIRDRHERAAGAEAEADLLHLALVEDVLYGLDINRHGVQLAACNLTLGNPRVDYRRMNLYTMQHGPQGDGAAKAGSLELLATAQDRRDIASLAAPLPTAEGLDAERAEPGAAPKHSLTGLFDLVIMNPPFTRNDIRNRQYGSSDRRALQQREIEIAQFLWKRDTAAFRAIDQSTVQTFFSPLADVLLKQEMATLASVVPTTALTSASGSAQRKFLAERIQLETVVTSHHPQRISFSENTSIHESLLVARRPRAERGPTRFVSLTRMPQDAHEAILLADRIMRGAPLEDWGVDHWWPWPRIRAGEWTAAQFCDAKLANAICDLAALAGTLLVPAKTLCQIEPSGRRIRAAFVRDAPPEAPWTAPILWDHVTHVRTSMNAEADVQGSPKRDQEQYAADLVKKASRLLVASRLRTNTVRVAACFAAEPALGSSWIPVRPTTPNEALQRALCAWWNSTPGILTLLNSRTKTLDYPSFSLRSLRALLVPDPAHADITPLTDAFEATRDITLSRWPQMNGCPARAALDEAAARVLRIDGRTIADWRRRIAVEPTVSGQPYPGLK